MIIEKWIWYEIKDGDPRAYDLMRRHYTYKKYSDNRRTNLCYRNRYLFAGPGEKIVLLSHDCKALFVWRKFISLDKEDGVNCAVFRNENSYLSSDLIIEAEKLAWQRWPMSRLYTYVNGNCVKSSNPGYCFLKAGWKRLNRRTKINKLYILEKLPGDGKSD